MPTQAAPVLPAPVTASPVLAAPVPMLDLARQYASVGEEVQAAIAEVCRTGRFVLGREVGEFETAFIAKYALGDAVSCASGTDALWLALAALGIGEGDAVITTPFTFFATVSSILRAGARPVLADIDPGTMNLSAEAAGAAVAQENAAGRSVRAVMPVHLYGQCADWDAFSALAEREGLALVEDAAQAVGASWRGVAAGALGHSAAFSFYPTKNLSAWGDAGLSSFRDTTAGERARALRGHGMRRRYYHDEVGWNSRLDTLQAAVLLVKLRHIDAWSQARQRVAARYSQTFIAAGVTGSVREGALLLPTADERGVHVWHQYVVRTLRRDDLRTHLTARGIGTEIYYPLSLHQQQALQHLGYRTGQFPESERAAATVLALPIYPELRDDEQDRVVEAVADFFR